MHWTLGRNESCRGVMVFCCRMSKIHLGRNEYGALWTRGVMVGAKCIWGETSSIRKNKTLKRPWFDRLAHLTKTTFEEHVGHLDRYLRNFCRTRANFIGFAGMSDTFQHLCVWWNSNEIISVIAEQTQVLEITPIAVSGTDKMSNKKSKCSPNRESPETSKTAVKKSKLQTNENSESDNLLCKEDPTSVVTSASQPTDKDNKDNAFQPIDEERVKPKERTPSRPGSGNFSSANRNSPISRGSPSISFFSGNPMVERTTGILHLYKDK